MTDTRVSRPGGSQTDSYDRPPASEPGLASTARQIVDASRYLAQAVYLETLAEELSGAERDHAIAVYSRRSLALGLREWRQADVTTPAPHRLYRARASDCYILGPGDQGLPVKISGSSPS